MFGKKKEEKTAIIYNLDNQPVCDVDKAEFLMPLSSEQQELLQHCLNHGIPIRSFAYKSIPVEIMNFILDVEFDYTLHYEHLKGENINIYDLQPSRQEMMIWSAVHTSFDNIGQFICQIYAIRYGVDIVNGIKDDAFSHSNAVWKLLTAASMTEKGKNMCKEIKSDDNKNIAKLQRFLLPYIEGLSTFEDYCHFMSLTSFYGQVQYEKFITGTVVFDYYNHLAEPGTYRPKG